MIVDADKIGLLTVPDDRRVTRVGRFLRQHKLDELPQLLNVLKGDMQFVGARPEVERYVQIFRAQYLTILQERPGITDPASLEYRHEDRVLPHDNAESLYISQVLPHKIQLSIEYQRRRSLFSDIHILFRTVFGLATNR